MPAVRLNITDDQEFKLCQFCSSELKPIDVNAVSSDTLYNKTLLSYGHLNCEKCGSYIELNDKLSSGKSTVFLCANANPHQHCLCAECGALYGYFEAMTKNNENELKSNKLKKSAKKYQKNKGAHSQLKWLPKNSNSANTTTSTPREPNNKWASISEGSTIELLWPPSGLWQTGTITHVWKENGEPNGEFAIKFEDDPFNEPLSYKLESYEYRLLTSGATTTTSTNSIKQEKTDNNNGDVEMKSTEDQNDSALAQEDDQNSQNDVDEIEAVIDYVQNDNEEIGEVFNVYRIKWKGFGMDQATWEPKDHLNGASEMIERYMQHVKACNPNSSKTRTVRRSPFDNNLLHDLWTVLSEHGNDEANQFGVVWESEGRAFQICDVDKFVTNFLSRNKHNIIEEGNYDSFSARMTVLGFEQEKESKLYHHPCFNAKSNKLIDFVGKNSIPLPDDEEKAALFKARVLKEKQEHIQPIIDDGPMDVYGGRKRMRSEYDRGMKEEVGQSQQAQISNYDYGLFVPMENNLDLNQAHLWTEHEVAEWIRHLPDWGNYYAAKFIENGVDGRILLEFDDMEMVMKECDIQNMHKATFIYGVNMLRNVRKSGLMQMHPTQAQ